MNNRFQLKWLSLWQYFIGFRIGSLQMKIGGYERPILILACRSILWSSKSSIWTISIMMVTCRPAFAQNQDLLYVQAFMSDTCCYMKQREGSLKRYSPVETSAPSLIISRSSRWHMANIVRWYEWQLRLLAVSARGHMAQGSLLVARHGLLIHAPFKERLFVKPDKRRHELRWFERKG